MVHAFTRLDEARVPMIPRRHEIYPAAEFDARAAGRRKGGVAKAPVKTGRESGMQEPHSEGVAHHTDPESCAGGGNAAGEAGPAHQNLAVWSTLRR